MKRFSLLLALLAMLTPTVALAAGEVTATKTATVVSDPFGLTATPRSFTGSVVDYRVVFTNNTTVLSGKTIATMVVSDVLPDKVKMRVSDIATAGKGPIEFTDGGLLGLFGSGLTYSFTSLSSTTDGIDFSSDGGLTWTYTPVADSNGYDTNVNAIRVKLTGTFTPGGSFQVRYRVVIR